MYMWILMAVLYGINILSIISIIFFEKRDMSTTFAWLLVLIFLPVIGFVLYFFFGSTKKLEVMSRKYRITRAEELYLHKRQELMQKSDTVDEILKDPENLLYRDMIQINSKNADCIFTENNNVKLLINGQQKFPCMFEDIRKAKSSINVMYFIIKSRDSIGKEMIDILAKKAAEGIKVRVIFDGLGCLKTRKKDFDPIVENGGEVQRFLPSMIRTIMLANYRLHRKMVVIDGQVCYTGGINVGDDYLGKYPKITPWRDTSVRITGSAVTELQFLFFKDWVFCARQNRRSFYMKNIEEPEKQPEEYFPGPEEPGVMGVQVIKYDPGNKYEAHKDSYVKMCTSAREYLYIQSPYFVPDQTLLESIRMAAQAGTDVRLMLPGIADKGFVYKVAMSYVEELLEAGVRVYTHEGFLHAKTVVIDDHVASVGTTNMDLRSFRLDYEVNTLVYSREFAIECRDTFLKDINDCKEIQLEEFKKRGKWEYIKESFCRFLIPLS